MSEINQKIEFKVTSSDATSVCNVLPCKIHHTGTATGSQDYFPVEDYKGYLQKRKELQHVKDVQDEQEPALENDDVKIAHFRGRRLLGVKADLPENYVGCVLQEGDFRMVAARPGVDDEQDGEPVSVKTWTPVTKFESMMVWGHETVPSKTTDPYRAGINDWVNLSHLVSSITLFL